MAASRHAPLGGKSKSQRRSTRIEHSRNLELLETRRLLSAGQVFPAVHGGTVVHPAAGAAFTGFTPVQIKKAYGFDQITGDGTGQTIAIIDAFGDASIKTDVAAFDTMYNLPAIQLTILNQNGKPNVSSYMDDPGGWDTETALDVEWAHAVAPGAKILLVESQDDLIVDLMAAENTARYVAGVSVISNSWGSREDNTGSIAVDAQGNPVVIASNASYDRFFLTPATHQPETFVAASGDFGVAAASWPATSPNVLSVGGTNLKLDSSNNYSSEGVWIGSQGGESLYEKTPAYQAAVSKTLFRSTPDVSYDADPNTGFAVYDGGGAWTVVGGTSAGSPQWAGFVADVNQMRVTNGLTSLNGVNETLPALYQLALGKKTRYTDNFNDVAVGQNGNTLTADLPTNPIPLSTVPNPRGGGFTGLAAKGGYDMVTGLGTPFVPALSQYLATFVPVKRVHRSPRQRAAGIAAAAAAVAFAKPVNSRASASAVFSNSLAQLPQIIAAPTVAAPIVPSPVVPPAAYTVTPLVHSSPAADQGILAASISVTPTATTFTMSPSQTRSLTADGSRYLITLTDTEAAPAVSDPQSTPPTDDADGDVEPNLATPSVDDGSIDAPATVPAPAAAPAAPLNVESDVSEPAAAPVVGVANARLTLPMMLGAVLGDAVVVGRWLQRRTARRRSPATPFGMARVTSQEDDEGDLC